jgi:hypothetical protein
VRLVVVVKSGGIRESSTALEDGHQAIGLLGGGKDTEDAFATGDGDALSLKLRDGIGHTIRGRLIGELQRHCVDY